MTSKHDERWWITPLKRDEIVADYQCPKLTCMAAPGVQCDRAPDSYLSVADRKGRMADGISHVERRLVSEGHSPDKALALADEYRAGGRKFSRHDDAAGDYKPETQIISGWMFAATLVPCDKHHASTGQPCSPGTVCRGRKHAAAEAARRGSRVPESHDRARAAEDGWVRVLREQCGADSADPELFDNILGPCGECAGCLGLDPMEISRLFGGDVVLASGSNDGGEFEGDG